MLRDRVIPLLLVRNRLLWKSKQFRDHRYVGDPSNAIKIFNHREADELVLLDIDASKEGRIFSAKEVELYASEARMPIAVGGGIRTVEQARTLLAAGAEKVCITTAALENPRLISDIASRFGSQAVVVGIDYKRTADGKDVCYTNAGTKAAAKDLGDFILEAEKLGAGEILLQSIDRDGSLEGYDLATVRKIAPKASLPIIIAGGASKVEDFKSAKKAGASAFAAGSMFVFYGRRQAVLVNYPDRSSMDALLSG